TERGRVPFADLVAAPHGITADATGGTVGPAAPDAAHHRLRLLPGDVAAELRTALADPVAPEGFPLRLTVRRIREAVNSTGTGVPGLVPGAASAAALHPDQLAALGLDAGATALVRSAHGTLRTAVRADSSVPPGAVTMTHGFESAAKVNELTGGAGAQAINAMPTLTAVPVSVTRVEEDDRCPT
ncbi:molybdopterin dinucleotide binding domain-containing protein, partial [Nocardia barduliensis]|uniref:molybdopterin dinucleotide binding domain-containing protein n=1 Tax=Nocardia barduliensis TaxID=2736643 RepID=UPI00248363A9